MRDPRPPAPRGLARARHQLRAQSGAAWYSVANYCAIASTLIGGIATARVLGAAGRGSYAVVVTASMILAVLAGLGVSLSFRRHASIHPDQVGLLARTAWRYGVAASVVALPVSAAVAPVLLDDPTRLEYLATIAALAASGMITVTTTYQQLLIAQGRLRELGTMRLCPSVVVAGVTVVLALTGVLTLTTAILVLIARPVSELVIGRRLVPHSLRGARVNLRPHLSFGLRSLPGQLAELGTVRIDQLLLLPAVGKAQLGRYAICVTAAGLTLTVAQSLVFKWFAAAAAQDGAAFRTYLARTVKLSGLCFVLGLPIALLGAPLIELLYGPQFSGLGLVLLYLVIGGAFLSGCYATAGFLVARGRPGRSAIGWGVSLLITVLAVPTVGRHWSIEGAAALSAVAYAAALAALLLMLRRSLRKEETAALLLRYQSVEISGGGA